VERIGPFGIRTSLRETSGPALTAASAMSACRSTEQLPSEPAFGLEFELEVLEIGGACPEQRQMLTRLRSSSCAGLDLAMLAAVAMVARPVAPGSWGVARFHLDAVPDRAEVRDLLQ